ncbi:cytochrome P450 [Saccharopolyspora erythraea NRRL 2338]|uniref:Cytochrome P450 monooxygenase n=2 Tax=Saccharopolyspora erythraea TaxID=1836 RepID=A4FBH2_SACEN|nr:cytochrome P450 [Saccharopolyspora erythraea]EQD84747.1 cytochrome P450 [Saccharopolyspora erythraea D]PFG95178.1 cytochrome P450 [Saccharopolyspora erythraea NRRL 2338]QRK91842.1 cytochrome P450 [Saccharopolyspora erythraea]CAM01397.1 cytochrome P450 monooxygenase [Saccharopolyspora erythraea NRRL 2338]
MTPKVSAALTTGVRTASPTDTARVAAQVVLPALATGVISRRPRVMALAERLRADRRAVGLLRELRSRYGAGPLRLRVPGRDVVLVLSPEHVRRVLVSDAESFTPANREKQAALGHFQPHGVLLSRGLDRARRRQFHEHVLETREHAHHLAPRFIQVVREEARVLLDEAERTGSLDWQTFGAGWWRVVRRIVLGDQARDDRELTGELDALRSDANWAFLSPKRLSLRRDLRARLREHLRRAEPGSLAETVARAETPVQAPEEQVPHWLFAFDAAGMAAFRALALLAAQPEQAARARSEIAESDLATPQPLHHLRACVLDALRLWPTTPMLLRDSVEETAWDGRQLPAGTAFLVFAPLFHRDETAADFAHAFTPEAWLDGRAEHHSALVPFSAGPGRCPGENLVLLVTSTLLAVLMRDAEFEPGEGPALGPQGPLPATFDNFHTTVRLAR